MRRLPVTTDAAQLLPLLQSLSPLPPRSVVKRTPRRRRNAVTMHEVAKHAGVSPMTVSRALSGDAHVEAATRQRVQAAVKELGYSPNVAARNLARAASLHIGLLYNNPSAA